MKVVFALHYAGNEKDFGRTDGGTQYGNRLLEHVIKLRERLEADGHTVLTRRELPPQEADVVLFGDLDPALWRLARSLPERIPCILICTESPIYTPMSHLPAHVLHRRWNQVLTWNRSYRAAHIHYYDIAVAGASSADRAALAQRGATSARAKGIVVTTLKAHQRGVTPMYNTLARRLAAEGLLDIYGAGWPVDPAHGTYGPTNDKISTMRQYAYSLLVENSLYEGYVTEKLPDSIVAGIPAIYFGDAKTAERRFPGTFVPLTELTEDAFRTALATLQATGGTLQRAITSAAGVSENWDESFVNAIVEAIRTIR